jgi:nucleoside-triphosphatase THEP1
VGFEIHDLIRGKRGWLSHVNGKEGSLVGKYRVNLADIDNIGAKAIIEAIEKSDVIAIDEIGPYRALSIKV